MLSKFDDYPIHQTNDPVAYTAASDRFTYDRFWYNGHDKTGAYYFGIGMARYPNLGILDCGFTIAIGDKQYAFHGSRRAPQEPTELSVGPFELQILEPMGRHRLVIGPNETGIECDLTFTPCTGAIEENRQTMRNERHVVMDVTRLDQFGHWQGSVAIDGEVLEIESDNTVGIKDRSWGIRPTGAPYEGGAPLDTYQPAHFMWAPLHWENRCTLAGVFENAEGHQWHTDQVITPKYASVDAIPGVNDPATLCWDGVANMDLKIQPGTRRATGGTITMNHRTGESMAIEFEPLLIGRLKGIGYMHPEWGHGHWKGELAIGSDRWDNSEVDPLALENLHFQQVVRVTCGDEVGYGVLEQMHIGPHARLGFKDWFDGA